jgi:hypothetical protein
LYNAGQNLPRVRKQSTSLERVIQHETENEMKLSMTFKLKIVACAEEESKSIAVTKLGYTRSKSGNVARAVINAALE